MVIIHKRLLKFFIDLVLGREKRKSVLESRKAKIIKKQIQNVNKKEKKLLNKKELTFIKNQTAPIQKKIESKIPENLQLTLERVFVTSFKMVFEKGTGVIEKSYNKEDKCLTFEVNHYTIVKQTNSKNLRKIDGAARKSIWMNQFLTTVEGSALGALGIGLPDIPLLIGMILKNIYEISLSYGFDYTQEKEKIYILYLICAGVSKGEQQVGYSKLLDEMINPKSQVNVEDYSREVVIKETAHQLAESMLVAKFIQGLPLIGVVGGISNFTMMKEISSMAKIKYKQRYLKQLL